MVAQLIEPETTDWWLESWGPAPRFATLRSPERPTYGPVIARVSEALGRPLYPWQRYVADVAGEVLPNGDWAYESIMMLVPRRAGKNTLVEAATVQRCTGPVPASVWMTAQKRDNAVKRWNDVRLSLARSSMRGIREIARAKVSQAFEVIEFRNGSTFRPFAPDEESMHGEAPDLVHIDELWALSLRDKKLIQAGYRPEWAFRSGQEWKFSAAGRRGRSGWLEHEREVGRAAVRAGKTRGVAYFEWSAPEALARDLARRAVHDESARAQLIDLIAAGHPRPGIRTEYLAAEYERDSADFLRAYGSVDDLDGGGESPIPLQVWAAAAWREASMLPDGMRVGFGVGIDSEGREGSICAAWRLPDGRGLVQVVERGPGVRWLAGRVIGLFDTWPEATAVAAGNTGDDRDLADSLRSALGEKCLPLSIADDKAATSRLVSEVTEGPTLFHDGKARPDMREALQSAAIVRGRFERRVGMQDPISVLPAAVRALWAADHLPAPAAPLPEFRIY